MATEKRKSLRGNLTLALISTVVTLALAEVVVRLFATDPIPPANHAQNVYPDNPRGYFTAHKEFFVAPMNPHLHGCQQAAQPNQVLFIGDSFTEGLGVRTEDTLSSRLEFPGHQRRNCGLSGQNLGGVHRSLVQQTARPKLTVYGLVLNDIAADPTPGAAQYSLDINLLPCPVTNFSDKPAADDRIMVHSQDLYQWYESRRKEWGIGSFLLHSELIAHFYKRSLRGELAAHMDAWYRDCWKPGERLNRGLDTVADMKKHTDHLLVIVWPLFVELGNYPFADIHQRIVAGLRQRGVEVLDLLPLFEGKDTLEMAVHDHDRHPNEVANQMAADAVAAHINQLGWVRVEDAPR